MENAADALKIGFALLVFVVALSIVFTMISKVKATADAVLYYADDTNYRGHIDAKTENRTVEKSDIISTLYRYDDESISVTIDINKTLYVFDLGNEVLAGVTQNVGSEEAREKMLGTFINTTFASSVPADAKFSEEFVEVPISGEYESGGDGSEIVVSSGAKKVYVTYTLK